MTTLHFQLQKMATPIGQLLLVTDEQHCLRAIDWEDYEERMYLLMRRQYKGVSITIQEMTKQSDVSRDLQAYFEGDIAIINTMKVVLGGTDFQRQVWSALREIPAGQPCSYGEQAIKIGRPNAVRAVGLANGANPISIVIPCHRVIGSNGQLTGYGGGLHRKRWLLQHESPLFSL